MKRSLCVIFLLLLQVSTYAQDLIIQGAPTAPMTVDRYQGFTITATVRNVGTLPTGSATTLKAYLSFDANWAQDDLLLGTSNSISSISANGTRSITINDAYTSNIPAGPYYLILYIDPDKTVNETDENNNIVVFNGYTVNPQNVDLLFNSMAPTVSTIPVSEQLLVNYELRNTGTTDLGNFTRSSFYLSTDNTFDAGDRFLFTHEISLAGPDIFNKTIAINVPPVPQGSYFLIARADDDHGIANIDELDETNNTAVAPITISASDIDLDVSSSFPTADFTNGVGTGDILVEYDLGNMGTTGVAGYDVHVYISTDQVLDAGDYDLTADLAPEISPEYVGAGPNMWVTGYVTQHVPNINTLVGTHYVIWKINASNAIPETDYTNNVMVSTNTITVTPVQPEMLLNSITFTSAPYDNTDVTFDFSAVFQNNGPINSFTHSFEILIRDASNTVVYTTTRPNESFTFPGAGLTVTKNWSVTLPAALAAGNYTLVVQCDPTKDCYSTSRSVVLEIKPAPYVITGTIVGSDGTNITSGKLYLYRKASNGTLTLEDTRTLSTNTYSLTVTDADLRALYFFPNTSTFNAFAPTLSGNYTHLDNGAFFTPTTSTVINLTPPRKGTIPAGTRHITGKVTMLPGPANAPNIPLLLYDGTTLVEIVYTDASGNYTIGGLAPKEYKLVASVAQTNYIVHKDFTIDVRDMNVQADILIDTNDIDINIIYLTLSQTITFNKPSDKVYTDAPFDLQATASSGLPITYESDDTDIIEINGSQAIIRGVGTVTITAHQPGNDFYDPATAVSQPLTVNKAPQTITFDAPTTKRSEDPDFALTAAASSTLPVTYTSSNAAVATIAGNVVSIHGEGETEITATQPGDDYFLAAAPVKRTLRVSDLITGIDNNPLAGVRLYPNPTSGLLTVEATVPVQQVTITDLAGRKQSLQVADDLLDIRHLPTGVYLVTLQNRTYTKVVKVIKK
jgi:hypothetical protein